MKATGITRKLDKLGRIVLPKEMCRNFKIETGDSLEIYVEDDKIILQKYEPSCIFCNSDQNVREFKDKYICEACLKELGEED